MAAILFHTFDSSGVEEDTEIEAETVEDAFELGLRRVFREGVTHNVATMAMTMNHRRISYINGSSIWPITGPGTTIS